MSKGDSANTKDNNGTIVYSDDSVLTKGNHSGMPKRTEAYKPTDERGHIQASSLGGDNTKDNVVPMDKELNHGAYYQMESKEREILNNGGKIHSEKIAYVSTQMGQRPDAFMVNDTIVFPDGSKQTVHLSFQNDPVQEQEEWLEILKEQPDFTECYDNVNPLKEMMTDEEYAKLMDETEELLSDIKDDYTEQIYVEFPENSEVSATDLTAKTASEDDSTELGAEFASYAEDFDSGDTSGETSEPSDAADQNNDSDTGALM